MLIKVLRLRIQSCLSHEISSARVVTMVLALLLCCSASAWAVTPHTSDDIRTEINAVESEMATLPKAIPSATPWTLGYCSKLFKSSENLVKIEIRFARAAVIDLVAILPATYLTDENGLKAFGFPERFKIELIFTNGSMEVIADYQEVDYQVSGVEPQLFPCPGAKPAIGLRITATRMGPNLTWWDATHVMALSEVFAFEGDANVALNAEVKAAPGKEFGYVWAQSCLVDGFSLFPHVDRDIGDTMDEFHAYADKVILIYDLGKECLIDEIRLWPTVFSIQHNFPPASGTSFPTAIRLERWEGPKGSASKVIYENDEGFPRPGANPFMHRVQAVKGRYFRLTLSNGQPDFRVDRPPRISLSEIQFLGKGKVLTQGKRAKVRLIGSKARGKKKSIMLTDGRTNEGVILPLRQWVEQFSRRAELNRQLTGLRANLETISRQEREQLQFFRSAAIVAIIFLLFIVFLVRWFAERRWSRMREQIGCDLHDQLGANLSSIAHTTELVKETISKPTVMQSQLLNNAIRTARLSARETKQFVRFLEQRKSGSELAGEMRKLAKQILGDIDHTFDFNAIKQFNQLDPASKWDFLFFLKESLNNVIKHACATHVDIITRKNGSRIYLIVADNGIGIADEHVRLHHLENRAKRLKGDLTVQAVSERGTTVTLTIKKRNLL